MSDGWMRDVVAGLGDEDRRRLLALLEEAIRGEMPPGPAGPGDARPPECPRCGCGRVVGHGRDGRGRRRWLCRGCGRSFGASTGRVLGATRLGAAAWREYASAMLDGATLRACARRAGVSLRTSFFMRHRLCEVMARTAPALRARRGCRVLLDELLVPDSLSGNHTRNPSFSMPRPARRRGQDGVRRGVSRDKVSVALALDERGGARAEAIGLGRGTRDGVHGFLVSCGVRRGCVLVSDDEPAYPAAALGTGARNELHPSGDRGPLNRMNALCSSLRHWLSRFRGVSTRRLANYLAWFTWALDARRAGSALALLEEEARARAYPTTRRGYAATPYPFHPELDESVGVSKEG